MSSEPSLSDPSPVAPGTILAGKYRVERLLGAGGMGVVVAAKNVELGKAVAIKMMLPAALGIPRAVERFEREARAVVQLRSEHVAEVLDIGKLPDGAPYIVMELLEGTDFEGLLRGSHRFEVVDAVDFLLQACEAIAEAHALGIVHRDLKPRNLFLTHRLDGSPFVKVLDFGISKWTPADTDSHALTRTSEVMGSPNYMSPEQVRSAKEVDGRTDIWSLGVILFELLAGRVPFLAESLPQLCAMVLEQQPPVLSALRPDIPRELVAVVARCLEKDPAVRFQSVAELVTALRPFAPARAFRTSQYSRPPSGSIPRLVAPAFSDTEQSPPPAVSPHAFTSSAPVFAGSRTSASWEDARPNVKKRRASPLVIVPVVLALLLVGVFIGMRAAATGGPEPTGPNASAAAPPTAASLVPLAPLSAAPVETTSTPPLEATATTTASAASAVTATTLAAVPSGARVLPTSHVAPPAAPDAAARPAPTTTTRPEPTADPLTPSDRK